ncbi:carboxylesterase family protein [Patulibacter sp. SYSU D01012]|uniref:carboxylesterase family protein n=1 Tax=Patulibacter sp. SYSU D01012 TaxID=2817381 RepID=UPI001B302852|nr:carboxylesterase family protein [Patulibacter sp. SYSU D01012]
MDGTVEVTAPAGRWRGTRGDGTAVFRGLRYARARRFAPPERAAPHAGTVDATAPGPAAPQLPSRLEAVMGAPGPFAQSEDCLRVTVTAPADAAPGSRAVLVWLHGGAYVSGGADWSFYDARRLVRETGIVVVTVGSRLGALGYLRADGVAAGNMGLLDQITAVEWVRDNVAAFGGDPRAVTLAGQSAGAQAAATMLGLERTRGLLRRVIVQSANLGVPLRTPQQAERIGRTFLAELRDDPHAAPLPVLLAAQARTLRRLAGPGGLNAAPPLMPIAGVHPVPDRAAWRAALARRGAEVQALVGTTADELRAFWDPNPLLRRVRRVPVVGPALVTRAQRTVQARVFDDPARELADLLAGAGARVHRYRIPRLHPASPYGACHCLDLPLLLGTPEAWAGAPMLRPLPPRQVDALGRRMRAAWGAFVASGDVDDHSWPAHHPEAPVLRELP